MDQGAPKLQTGHSGPRTSASSTTQPDTEVAQFPWGRSYCSPRMPPSTVKVARGLLLHGDRLAHGSPSAKAAFFRNTGGGSNNAFSEAAAAIGGKVRAPGLRFFEVTRQRLAYGPGAGLVLGVAVGSESLRAGLVDANGQLHLEHEAEHWPGQLSAPPTAVLDRIRDAAAAVLTPAFDEPDLLVDGALPFLGVAVAWPTPVDRQKRPGGQALAHPNWRSGRTLIQRVAHSLKIEDTRSHALNDAHAAAIAVAFNETRAAAHLRQEHPHLTFVIRVGGGIGAGTIIIEEPRDGGEFGPTSGFPDSILIAGFDQHAGELGHVRVSETLVADLDRDRPAGLGKLVPFHCSCVGGGAGLVPHHLEAYAAAPALAHRIDPTAPMSEVIHGVLSDPDDESHRRALDDVGVLVAEALLGPIAMLNPKMIVLTGALAPKIADSVDAHIAQADHPIHSHPYVKALDREENAYIRVKGAALAILREHVHRQLPSLLAGPAGSLGTSVRGLTTPLTGLPWRGSGGRTR